MENWLFIIIVIIFALPTIAIVLDALSKEPVLWMFLLIAVAVVAGAQ